MTATQPQPVFGIAHQRQPTNKTCVQTCIAMALGVPVEKVIERYGGEALNQELLTKTLTECGVLWNQFTHGTMLYQGWYFAVAPSLNHRGLNHQILVRWTPDDGVTVMDPSSGDTYAQDGNDLKCWECLVPFVPGGNIPPEKGVDRALND